MKKLIGEYASYNVWANERICSVIASLSDEKFNREVVSSFSSIQKTMLHMWVAQLIWIKRLEGLSLSVVPSEEFHGTRDDIVNGIISTSEILEEIAGSFSKEDLKSFRKYTTLKSGDFVSSQYEMLVHVFNHSTYHRGQLVTMLRQLGVTELPQTDLIFYYRQTKT